MKRCVLLAMAMVVGLAGFTGLSAMQMQESAETPVTVSERGVALRTAALGLDGEQAAALQAYESELAAARARMEDLRSVLDHAKSISLAAEHAALADELEALSDELRGLSAHAEAVEVLLDDQQKAQIGLSPERLLPPR